MNQLSMSWSSVCCFIVTLSLPLASPVMAQEEVITSPPADQPSAAPSPSDAVTPSGESSVPTYVPPYPESETTPAPVDMPASGEAPPPVENVQKSEGAVATDQEVTQPTETPATEEKIAVKKEQPEASPKAAEELAKDALQPDNTQPSKADGLMPKDGTPKEELIWLPDWPKPPFGWTIGPVVGFRYGVEENPELGRSQVSSVEGGVVGSVSHIPIVDSTPGDWLSPFAGGAVGYSIIKGEEGNDRYRYYRAWGGLQNKLMWGPLKYELTVSRGILNYNEKPEWMVHSFGLGNDFGVLLLDWLSAHETLNYTQAYHDDFDTPFLKEYDNWIHARARFRPMDLVVDAGPGFTLAKAYEQDSGDMIAEGITRYVKGVADFELFWGLGGTALAKYAFDSSESRLGVYDRRRLPMEALNEPPTLTMPEDSFQGSLFLGFKDIIFGIGFGWRYNIAILSFAGRHDRERETTTDQGFGLYKEVRF